MKQLCVLEPPNFARRATTSLKPSESDNKRTFQDTRKLIASQYWGMEGQQTEIQPARQYYSVLFTSRKCNGCNETMQVSLRSLSSRIQAYVLPDVATCQCARGDRKFETTWLGHFQRLSRNVRHQSASDAAPQARRKET